eukprot:7660723-Prorocentrum_lima.AAC.1
MAQQVQEEEQRLNAALLQEQSLMIAPTDPYQTSPPPAVDPTFPWTQPSQISPIRSNGGAAAWLLAQQ